MQELYHHFIQMMILSEGYQGIRVFKAQGLALISNLGINYLGENTYFMPNSANENFGLQGLPFSAIYYPRME